MDLSEAAAGLNLCCGDVWATAFLFHRKVRPMKEKPSGGCTLRAKEIWPLKRPRSGASPACRTLFYRRNESERIRDDKRTAIFTGSGSESFFNTGGGGIPQAIRGCG